MKHSLGEYLALILAQKTIGARFAGSVFIYIVCAIAIFPKMFPQDTLIDFLSVIVAGFFGLYALINVRKLGLIDGLLMLIASIITFVTLFNGNLSLGIFTSIIINAFFPIFIRGELRKTNKIINVLFNLCVFVILGTALTMFSPSIGPDGYPWYMIGGKNALATALIPAVFITVIFSYIKKQRIDLKTRLLALVALSCIVVGGSATGTVGAVLAAVYILFGNRKIMPAGLLFLIYPLIQTIFWNTNFILTQPIVASIITDYFGKSLTFTHRSDVWQSAMDGIGNSVLFGHGRNNGIVHSNFPTLNEAHNITLEVLLTGGIIFNK